MSNSPYTHIFGQSAREIRDANGWTDAVIADRFNAQTGANGQTEATKRIIGITPPPPQGYTGEDFYLGQRKHVEVVGIPGARPKLVGDEVAIGVNKTLTLRNLELQNCPVAIVSTDDTSEGAVVTYYEDIYQHSFNRDQNGFRNPHGRTVYPESTTFKRCKLDATGSPGNTRHQVYIEGRPLSTLVFDECEVRGARACSGIKTTCNDVQIRNSLLSTLSLIDPMATTGTLVDAPACSRLTMSANTLELWRNPVPRVEPRGLATPAVFLRLRRESLGSDSPAYPDIDWNPPQSSQGTRSSPGEGWGAGPETYVSEGFWRAVLAAWEHPELSEFYLNFASFISYNKFKLLAGSDPVPWLRNDGTRAAEAVTQFSSTSLGLQMPEPLWVERSTVFHAMNLFDEGVLGPVMRDEAPFKPKWRPGITIPAPWTHDSFVLPRMMPHHFPRAIEVMPSGLPSWFQT